MGELHWHYILPGVLIIWAAWRMWRRTAWQRAFSPQIGYRTVAAIGLLIAAVVCAVSTYALLTHGDMIWFVPLFLSILYFFTS